MIKELNEEPGTKRLEEPEQTDATCSKTTSPTKRTFLAANPKPDIEKYKNFLIKPLETKRLKPSETLSKVRDFLPLLKDSTSKLLEDFKENPDSVNIENVGEDEQHIEMNLAYVTESESDSSDESEESEEQESDKNSEEGSLDESALTDVGLGFKVKDPSLVNLRLATSVKTKMKPLIKMIDDQESEMADNNQAKTSKDV